MLEPPAPPLGTLLIKIMAAVVTRSLTRLLTSTRLKQTHVKVKLVILVTIQPGCNEQKWPAGPKMFVITEFDYMQ